MRNRLLIPTIILLSAGVHTMARQNPPASKADPCNDQASIETRADSMADKKDDKKKEAIEHDPLVDPTVEMRIRAEKKMDEKNFMELQQAATELATITTRMSKEIDAGGQFVVSLRVLNDLDQVEKLTKKVRSRAK